MAYHERRHALLPGELCEQVEHGAHGHLVELSRRLVGDDELWRMGDRRTERERQKC